jgi:LysR family transcriptional regulator, nitrogen assimilation regulatory protein
VLPRRPSHWRNALDDTARSLGFKLEPVAEADSLTVQRELVVSCPGLHSVLGPYSIADDLRRGRLQASKLVRPDLARHVTLAFPRHGKLSPAARVVAATVQALVKSWGQQLTEP